METNPELYRKFDRYYTPRKLQGKLRRIARKAGSKAVYTALVLYYVMQSPGFPLLEKIKIAGVLGYLICPSDLIPDVLPALGLTDDAAALMWAYNSIRRHITPEVEARAAAHTARLFPDDEKQQPVD